ncbi:TetR/AcrR family transcriptional regulator [Aestuariimicrobium soli]|uniref:TetR/AcrR family transcriptional regulator n=1 Tax=Aestuariimicrobium soli TaxID=2035834 RepID=UPI003EBA63B3
MPSQRERALDAAIDLLGTRGLKALTHRGVDRRADLPPGSTSNYFRTRDALLVGASERIVEREVQGFGAVEVTSAEALIDLIVRLIDLTTRTNRTMTAARLVLFLESSHHEGLRTTLWRGREQMAAMLEPQVAGLGARDPRTTTVALMACAEGVILHRIARHDDEEVRPLIEAVVRGALGSTVPSHEQGTG